MSHLLKLFWSSLIIGRQRTLFTWTPSPHLILFVKYEVPRHQVSATRIAVFLSWKTAVLFSGLEGHCVASGTEDYPTFHLVAEEAVLTLFPFMS